MPSVTTRNARFQQWQALLGNRVKRQRAGAVLVQGVRPITLALAHHHPVRELLINRDVRLSRWAGELRDTVPAETVQVSGELMAELGERADAAPELLAVVAMPADDLGRIRVHDSLLAVVLDRPTSPGNLGTVVRSADAFGAHGVIVTGHAADPYDPKAVRASTGSLFAVPVVRVPSPEKVLAWAGAAGALLVATDEHGTTTLEEADLVGPTVLLVGNETVGLSAAWRQAADLEVRIPIAGSASSLNAAVAASIALYEVARQRGGPAPAGRRA